MTVIRPNSISGINSITGNGGDISIFRADGTAADVTVNNITSGVITATTGTFTGNLGVGGVLTYEDVTNIDSVGVITARDGLRVTGIATISGDLSIADKIIHTGDTDTSIRFSGADTITAETGGSERTRISSDGHLGINTDFTGSQIWRAGKRLEIFGGSGNVTGELHLGANRGDGTQSVGSINFFDNTQDSTHRHIALIETDKSGTTSNKRGGTMVFYTKTDNVAAPTEKLRIHATGAVTKPLQPSFIAGRTGGNQTFTVGVYPLNVARLNVGNHYNTSTYKFVAPVAGVYYFYGQVYYNNGSGSYRVGIRKTPNGGSAFMLNTAGHKMVDNDNQQNTAIIESMAVGDAVDLFCDSNVSMQCYYNINDNTYGAHTYFMGYLIG